MNAARSCLAATCALFVCGAALVVCVPASEADYVGGDAESAVDGAPNGDGASGTILILAQNQLSPNYLALSRDGVYVYWTADDGVWGAQIDGGGSVFKLSRPLHATPERIAVDSTYAYWIEDVRKPDASGALARVSLDGGDAGQVAPSKYVDVQGVTLALATASDNVERLYWTQKSTGALLTLDTDAVDAAPTSVSISNGPAAGAELWVASRLGTGVTLSSAATTQTWEVSGLVSLAPKNITPAPEANGFEINGATSGGGDTYLGGVDTNGVGTIWRAGLTATAASSVFSYSWALLADLGTSNDCAVWAGGFPDGAPSVIGEACSSNSGASLPIEPKYLSSVVGVVATDTYVFWTTATPPARGSGMVIRYTP